MAVKKEKSKKMIFVQDWYVWQSETLVLVGASLTDGLAYARKIKAKKSFTDWIQELIKNHPENGGLSSSLGRMYYNNDSHHSILMLKECRDDWAYWETMLHEIIHLIDDILTKGRNMENEYEARAYTAEFLFRTLRRKISGEEPL